MEEKSSKTVSGNIVDVLGSEIYPGTVKISNNRIEEITRERRDYKTYIIPGFIDSHIHIESSMLVPSEFARVAVIHGTVATVSDPHEIANVLGVDGIKYMIENSETVPMKFYFGAPSCVPASDFETSGATLGPEQVEELLKLEKIKYLAEVMNFPGVINGAPDVIRKIEIAKNYSKLIDGHAPGLRGKDLEKYVNAGISTDHECFSREEALEKIRLDMKVLIREGSAAKDFDELIPIVEEHYERCMFCSDDKHPDNLLKGHMNDLVKRALDYGIDLMKVLRVSCVNPVLHYGLDVGLLRKGDNADFLVVDDIRNFNILKTYINGEIVAEGGRSLISKIPAKIVNNFNVKMKNIDDFFLMYKKGNIKVIEAIDGQLITNKLIVTPKIVEGYVVSDTQRDILKMAVINRYRESKPAIGFVKNFGLKKGAIASSVAHDSHNIIAVGTTERDICRAVNLIIEEKGGISAVSREKEMIMPLPVAGIMSNKDYSDVAEEYAAINNMAKKYLGSTLHAPFMTLSFMALLVIPKIKLSDKGLFDGEKFQFIDVFEA
jgi:adenine deaminase